MEYNSLIENKHEKDRKCGNKNVNVGFLHWQKLRHSLRFFCCEYVYAISHNGIHERIDAQYIGVNLTLLSAAQYSRVKGHNKR